MYHHLDLASSLQGLLPLPRRALGSALTEHCSCANVAVLGRAARCGQVWDAETLVRRRYARRRAHTTTSDPSRLKARRVLRPSHGTSSSPTRSSSHHHCPWLLLLLLCLLPPPSSLLLVAHHTFASRSRIMQEGPRHTQLRGPVRDRLHAKHMVSDLHLGRHRVAAAHEAARRRR